MESRGLGFQVALEDAGARRATILAQRLLQEIARVFLFAAQHRRGGKFAVIVGGIGVLREIAEFFQAPRGDDGQLPILGKHLDFQYLAQRIDGMHAAFEPLEHFLGAIEQAGLPGRDRRDMAQYRLVGRQSPVAASGHPGQHTRIFAKAGP